MRLYVQWNMKTFLVVLDLAKVIWHISIGQDSPVVSVAYFVVDGLVKQFIEIKVDNAIHETMLEQVRECLIKRGCVESPTKDSSQFIQQWTWSESAKSEKLGFELCALKSILDGQPFELRLQKLRGYAQSFSKESGCC